MVNTMQNLRQKCVSVPVEVPASEDWKVLQISLPVLIGDKLFEKGFLFLDNDGLLRAVIVKEQEWPEKRPWRIYILDRRSGGIHLDKLLFPYTLAQAVNYVTETPEFWRR
jgi:hypothetical protein